MAAVAHPHRPHVRRNSPLSASNGIHGFSADAPMLKRIDIGDSDSDDEPPPAIKFSKETQALLADARAPSPPRYEKAYEIPRFNRSVNSSRAASDTPSRAPGIKIIRRSSPAASTELASRGNTPRIVQVGGNGSASGKRSISISGSYPHRPPFKREPTPSSDARQDLITPAPAPRALRVRTRSNSINAQDRAGSRESAFSRPGSRDGPKSSTEQASEIHDGSELRRSASQHQAPETISRLGSMTGGRSRNTSVDPAPPPGSTRVKRAPIGTGSFLKSGPVRRGFRRRDSEDNVSPAEEAQSGSQSQASATGYTPGTGSSTKADAARSRAGSMNTRATSVEPVSIHDFAAHRNQASYERRPESRQGGSYLSRSQLSSDSRPPSRNAYDQVRSRQASVEPPQQRRQTGIHHDEPPAPAPAPIEHAAPRTSIENPPPRQPFESKPPQRAPSLRAAQHRYVPHKLHTDASEDQENMPPPTFRRNKDAEFKHLGKAPISILLDNDMPKQRQVDETPVPKQPEQRKALGAISGNTPHRAAPAPPPKMSVIDTATTTAGASVTKSKKKRSHILVNGKIFTQMGKIGSGGSCVVYCVMAENYMTFALKRVKLGNCDESAVRGYKGEIELLKKCTEVERVVRLFDWELNEEKQELVVLLEKGDTDLNRLLTLRLNGEQAKFDPLFTKFYWKEMLECVQAVHDMDIVHSDLKPANFLLVQGRLKLIDFGIANAIETDHTVNVHRDTHVGTPNYMSPESITDTNAPPHGESAKDAAGRPLKKDMKIGKASDVWSLGCILYQMTYGRPPFGHIPNQLSRIMAITNPNHLITYPETGVGGVVVPSSLKAIMRKCLNRDPDQRPTVKQLLQDDNPCLYPEQPGSVIMTEDLLNQVITKVVHRCKDTKAGFPTSAELALYPRSFMEKIRQLNEQV